MSPTSGNVVGMSIISKKATKSVSTNYNFDSDNASTIGPSTITAKHLEGKYFRKIVGVTTTFDDVTSHRKSIFGVRSDHKFSIFCVKFVLNHAERRREEGEKSQ